MIIMNMEADSYEDVFKQLGGVLVSEGYAKSTFIEALSAREKEFPTGLDMDGFGVAIPHTDVSHVNKAAIAVAVLKRPVTFIQMGSEDDEVNVRLVFLLSIVEPDAYMEELQKLLEIMQDTNVLKQITEAEDEQMIIDIVKEKENTI